MGGAHDEPGTGFGPKSPGFIGTDGESNFGGGGTLQEQDAGLLGSPLGSLHVEGSTSPFECFPGRQSLPEKEQVDKLPLEFGAGP